MIAPVSKYLDWWAIQFVTMMLPPANGRNPRLEEALQFLKGPDFIPAESQPARVEFNPDESGLHLRFPTPRPCAFAENNVVYGRLYRCTERWQERPVIVLLHGGSDFINHRFRFPLIARHCNRAGLNAATLVLPYHFQRRPRQLGALSSPDYLQMAEGPGFPFPASRAFSSLNYLRMAEAMAQGIAEIRALTGWLLGEGCPAVALWGFSLGGLAGGVGGVPRCALSLCRSDRTRRALRFPVRRTDLQSSRSGGMAGAAHGVGDIESDRVECDLGPAGHPQGKYLIDRRDP